MTDIVLDTETITINVVTGTDIDIINIEAPPYVMQGDNITLEFDVVNHGSLTNCFAAVKHDGTNVHRWDGNIATDGTEHVACSVVASSTDDVVLTITAGYTHA